MYGLLICCAFTEEDYDKFFVTVPFLPPVDLSRQDAQVDVDTFANHSETFSMQPLLDELGERWQFSWIKQRMRLMWPEINLAARYVTNASCSQWMRPRLRVFTSFFTFANICLLCPILFYWNSLYEEVECKCKQFNLCENVHVKKNTREGYLSWLFLIWEEIRFKNILDGMKYTVFQKM